MHKQRCTHNTNTMQICSSQSIWRAQIRIANRPAITRRVFVAVSMTFARARTHIGTWRVPIVKLESLDSWPLLRVRVGARSHTRTRTVAAVAPSSQRELTRAPGS